MAHHITDVPKLRPLILICDYSSFNWIGGRAGGSKQTNYYRVSVPHTPLLAEYRIWSIMEHLYQDFPWLSWHEVMSVKREIGRGAVAVEHR
jgi:hypothetical protein